MKLAKKVALITGAGAGMGLAAAVMFAEEGAAIAAVDINEAAAAQTASRITAQGRRAIGIRADVSKAADVKQMFARAVEEFGRLDVVYNNAAIIEETTQLEDFDDDAFDRVIAVNLRGVYLGMKYALPHLIAAGGGSIINTGSIAGFTSFRGSPAYTAAKAGVVALTKVAGLQWAKHKIRVNAICPGPVFTPMAEGIHRRMTGRELRPNTRMPASASGRMAMPEEIARVALFLASDDSSYINATPITVDGGWGV
jgi:NAD(P)-dependent dehydrogenase (short-subunit alcohol dehydrogenase family)